jgi:hypothetical protein
MLKNYDSLQDNNSLYVWMKVLGTKTKKKVLGQKRGRSVRKEWRNLYIVINIYFAFSMGNEYYNGNRFSSFLDVLLKENPEKKK